MNVWQKKIIELEETIARIRAETAKNSGEVAAATDGKQIVTMAEEGAWQAAMIGKSGGPWSGTTLEALIDQYANGIYIGKISNPPLSVCVEHLREFATKLLALATPANSRAEAIGAFKAFYRGLEKAPADMPITAGSSMAKRQLTVGDLRALLQQEGE